MTWQTVLDVIFLLWLSLRLVMYLSEVIMSFKSMWPKRIHILADQAHKLSKYTEADRHFRIVIFWFGTLMVLGFIVRLWQLLGASRCQ